MKTDSQLQQDVQDELKWEPSIDHEKIGVAVDKGVVTLSGIVPSFANKLLVEKSVRRVKGVRAIAEELIVRYPSMAKTSDSEIAKRVADVLEWNSLIPSNKIKVAVEKGVVKLTGTVEWHYQKNFAFKDASKITGVVRVDNRIEVAPAVSTTDVRSRIEKAFERQADLEAEKISVRADGHKIVLDGRVSSLGKRAIAERAAWSAPGVTQIEDNLAVA